MLRRDLLSGAAAASLGLLPVGRSAWAVTGELPAAAPRRLIVVFLRGAADGLNIVVPYADPGYYQARSSIALARPGTEGGALELDRRFGLHPALAPLMALWQSGKLGFIHEDRDAVLVAVDGFDKGLDVADALHLARSSRTSGFASTGRHRPLCDPRL